MAWADPGCRWVTPPEVVGAAGGLVLAAVAGRVLLPERWHQVMMGPIIRTVVGGATQVSFGVRLRFPK